MTTTIAPIHLPEAATKLKNGAWVLASKPSRLEPDAVVLAFHSGAGAAQPFCTWRLNPNGHTYWGHYYENLEDAFADYQERP